MAFEDCRKTKRAINTKCECLDNNERLLGFKKSTFLYWIETRCDMEIECYVLHVILEDIIFVKVSHSLKSVAVEG